jgi:type IV pilus assembly protein PilW
MMKMRKNGFSLIELMVAITISMVAMVAVSEVYVSTRQTYKLQNMQSPLADEGRFAISMIQRIVSQAGYRPLPWTTMVAHRIAIATGAATNSITVKFDRDGSNQINCDGSTDAKVPAVPPAVPLAVPPILRIEQNGRKLRCGPVNADGTVNGDGSINANGTVTAANWVDWIVPATAGTGNSSDVVDFAVAYGIDTGPAMTPANFGCGTEAAGNKPRDCIADSYATALPGVATDDQIVAVKVCLILSSEATDSSVIKPAAVKNCGGTDIGGSQANHKLYRTFRTTVLLKNR